MKFLLDHNYCLYCKLQTPNIKGSYVGKFLSNGNFDRSGALIYPSTESIVSAAQYYINNQTVIDDRLYRFLFKNSNVGIFV